MEDESKPAAKRELVGELLNQGFTQAEVGRRVGMSKATVSYHARRLGVPARDACARRYDWNEIQRAYDSGLSVRQCAARFGFSKGAWWKAVERGAVIARAQAAPIEEFLVAGRPTTRSHLRKRLIKEGLKENRCERCGITEWMGKPLSFELHHVNGNGDDNRLENLQVLCGNCHSQTPNWGGRNTKRGQAKGTRRKDPC